MNTDISSRLSRAVTNIPASAIREFFLVLSETEGSISLSVGEPDFPPVKTAIEAAVKSLRAGQTGYSDSKGYLPLRERIASYAQKKFGCAWNPRDEILLTVGVSEALDLCLRALINPGDQVLYHEPCFVSYVPIITLCLGEPRVVQTHFKDKFALEVEALYERWTPKTKVLILSFPNNPTGATLNKKQLENIAHFVMEKDLLLISDEIYAELNHEGPHCSITNIAGMKERTVLLHGFSKAFAMTGLRLGYAAGPSPIIKAMARIHQYSIMCPSVTTQYAAMGALEEAGIKEMKGMCATFKKRRDYFCGRLKGMGLPHHAPRGAFYVFFNISASGLSSLDFAKRFLKEHQVALVPGTAFGSKAEGFIRASFANNIESLKTACDRLEIFLKSLPTS